MVQIGSPRIPLSNFRCSVEQQIVHIYTSVPSEFFFSIRRIVPAVDVKKLALGHAPGSLTSACLGLLVGFIYRSELVNIKTWRVSPAVIRFSTRFLLPLVGSTRPPRRLNRARPDRQEPIAESVNEEAVTTARSPAPATRTDSAPSQVQGEAGSVVREWVNELTGRTEDSARIRTPSEAEISQLVAMFPDISRDLITRTLQRT